MHKFHLLSTTAITQFDFESERQDERDIVPVVEVEPSLDGDGDADGDTDTDL